MGEIDREFKADPFDDNFKEISQLLNNMPVSSDPFMDIETFAILIAMKKKRRLTELDRIRSIVRSKFGVKL